MDSSYHRDGNCHEYGAFSWNDEYPRYGGGCTLGSLGILSHVHILNLGQTDKQTDNATKNTKGSGENIKQPQHKFHKSGSN